jgi:stage II sporulation protein E
MNVYEKMRNIKSTAAAASRANALWMKPVAMAGLHFLLAFLMSAIRITGYAAPFGAATVAAAGAGLSGICALAGATLGYLATGGLAWGVKYAAASVLVFTVRFVLQDLRICRRSCSCPSARRW